MIGNGHHNMAYIPDGAPKPAGWVPSVTEQQMIMKQLCLNVPDAEAAIYYAKVPKVRPGARSKAGKGGNKARTAGKALEEVAIGPFPAAMRRTASA